MTYREELNTLTDKDMAAREELDEQFRRAASELMARMAPGHVQIAIEWEARPEVRADFSRHPRDPWPRREARLGHPRLGSVVHWLMYFHLDDGRPLELPPQVAQIYIDDDDVYPLRPVPAGRRRRANS